MVEWWALGARNNDGEAGFYTWLRCGFDGSVMGFYCTFDYGQTETSAFDVGLGVVLVHAVKTFENER